MDRFPVLRGISVSLKILAVLVLVAGILIGLVGRGTGNQLGAIATFGTFLIAAIYAIGLWVSAEMIGVLLAIEENTRQSASLMARLTPTSTVTGATPASTERPIGRR
ncbi:MAG: hypothetical protein M3509_10415 [Chloroflexota bacterium]|nr:hypothetical protein [Chloroflexota bacterium]